MTREEPLHELARWLWHGPRMVTFVLCAIAVLSAIGVVAASHDTRRMYRDIQVLQQEQDDLESEYEKLLLEQSAWSNNSRVDQVAREDLKMVPPVVQNIVVVRTQ